MEVNMAALWKWQQENPRIVIDCRRADDILDEVQTQLIERLAGDVQPEMTHTEFMVDEYLDNWGRRLASLQTIRQILNIMGTPAPNGPPQPPTA